MRPLKLTLRGINSYRKEQTIDYTRSRVRRPVGIFGPTGSGKSSILDAITLALYAKLPRSTKNFININEETAAVSFFFPSRPPKHISIRWNVPFAITGAVLPPPCETPAPRWQRSRKKDRAFSRTVRQK